MKIYHGFKDPALKPRPRAVAIGIFDGVHRGHQKILKAMLRQASQKKLTPLVLTFDPHPIKILKPSAAHPIIMSLAHRLRFLESMGIQETLVIYFDKKFAAISHPDFLTKLLIKKLGMKSLSVGHDFRFGRGGQGDILFLKKESKALDTHLQVVSPLTFKNEIISSTRIRQLVERGDLSKATQMLGRPVSVYGTVVRGRGRGKSLGFPTANLNPHHETLPPGGVYAAWGYLGKRKLKGVIHIGQRPTFKDRQATLEVHFLNFHEKIYGSDIELIFVKRLRETRAFESPQALITAIRKDAKQALQALK